MTRISGVQIKNPIQLPGQKGARQKAVVHFLWILLCGRGVRKQAVLHENGMELIRKMLTLPDNRGQGRRWNPAVQ